MMVIQMRFISYTIRIWQHSHGNLNGSLVKFKNTRKDLVEIYERAYDEAVLEGYKLEDYDVDRGVKYGIIGK